MSKKCKVTYQICKMCTPEVSARRASAQSKHEAHEGLIQKAFVFFVPFVWKTRVLREQAPLSAARVGLVVGAVAQRRQCELGKNPVTAICGVEPIGRIVRRLIEPRITKQIDDEDAL